MFIYVGEEYDVIEETWMVTFATKSLERALAWEAENEDDRVITKVELEG